MDQKYESPDSLRTSGVVKHLTWIVAAALSNALAQAHDTAAQAEDPLRYGAKCDGVTDDWAALTTAIKNAQNKGVVVELPGATCAYRSVLALDGVKLIGRGDATLLWALDPMNAAIFLPGSGSEVRNLKLAGVAPISRTAALEGSRVVAVGASNFVVDNVTIDGSASGGIRTSKGAAQGLISNNRVSNTLADGIHITGRASHINISHNLVETTGDDGIAVVSYQGDGGMSHHITATHNVVRNNKGGRGMSVVGGSDVLYENNRISNTGRFACVYLAQEDSYKTLPTSNVIVRNNTLTNCGSPLTGHAAVMLFGNSMTNVYVQIQGNDIVQSGQRGIRAFGSNSEVKIEGNRVNGASQAYQLAPGIHATPYSSGPVGTN